MLRPYKRIADARTEESSQSKVETSKKERKKERKKEKF
jgi:hypothetical protein